MRVVSLEYYGIWLSSVQAFSVGIYSLYRLSVDERTFFLQVSVRLSVSSSYAVVLYESDWADCLVYNQCRVIAEGIQKVDSFQFLFAYSPQESAD